MVLVVKGTFDVVADGNARLSEPQRPCHGPKFFDDDAEQSMRLNSDFALVKRVGECLLAGTCHPPVPARISAVRFAVGEIEKTIGVMGDRIWTRGLMGSKPTEPEMFTSMPLRWERAFGGPTDSNNPLGCGARPPKDGPHRLPNLEDPKRLITTPDQRPKPHGAFPIPPTWSSRMRHSGTYDARWVAERFPHFPNDFNPAFYQAAPEDQRLRSGFWRGDETITLSNLIERQPKVRTMLPGIRPRGFVQRDGRFDEIPLHLDTITIDADAAQIMCLWRGATVVTDERLSGVRHLFLMDQPIRERRSVKSCRRQMRGHLRLRQLVDTGFEPKTPAEEEEMTIAIGRLKKKFSADPAMDALVSSAVAVVDSTIVATPDEPAAAAAPPPPIQSAADDLDEELEDDALADFGEDERAPPTADSTAPPIDIDAIEAAFAEASLEVPDEVREVLAACAELQDLRRESEPTSEPPIEPGTTAAFLLAYAEKGVVSGNYSGIDVSGNDLEGLIADGAILDGASFRGCRLDNAQFSEAVLIRACFDDASLENAVFLDADLTRASAQRASLPLATLDRATLEDANFASANLSRASLQDIEGARINLEGANLCAASCDEADFTRANLTGARADRASFFDARLSTACCVDATFEDANLEQVRAAFGARFDRAVLRGADAKGARFFGSILRGANLSLATFDSADFSSADLTDAKVAGSSFRKARLIDADLRRARLIKCDLMKANLLRANLERADLRGSSLHAAELFAARTSGAVFELADLSGTKLEGKVP